MELWMLTIDDKDEDAKLVNQGLLCRGCGKGSSNRICESWSRTTKEARGDVEGDIAKIALKNHLKREVYARDGGHGARKRR